MAQEMFFVKKFLCQDMKQTSEASKEGIQALTTTDNLEAANVLNLKDILSAWCKSPTVENQIKSCSSGRSIQDIGLHAKVNRTSFIVFAGKFVVFLLS